MPDVLEQPPASLEAPTPQPAINAELAANMAASLNGYLPKDQQIVVPDAPAEGAPPAEQAPIVNNPPVTQPDSIVPPATPFQFTPFTEKFGYQTPEEAIKEIEELRTFKNSPGHPVEFKDEESAELFKSFTTGDREKLREYLNAQHNISRLVSLEVTKDSAAEIVKYGMQLKYKDLKPEEVEYMYNKKFTIPPKPMQGADEEEIDYNERVSQWQQVASDRQMELLIEAKMMRPDLESAKKQITLPKAIETPDEAYAQYQKMLEQQDKIKADTQQAYKAFTPKSIESKVKFIDEANKIDFEFQYEPDKDSFAKTVELVSDEEKFWKLFSLPDGTPDRLKWFKAVHFMLNEEQYITEAMTQAKNAALKANLPDNSSGIVRQLPQSQEENELDKQMKIALQGHM